MNETCDRCGETKKDVRLRVIPGHGSMMVCVPCEKRIKGGGQ